MMGKKSEFAQRLLDDLKLRKERMAAGAGQSYGQSYNLTTSKDAQGLSAKGKREAPGMASHKIGMSKRDSMHKRSSSCSGSIGLEDNLKQLVPFNQGIGGKERGDLVMALESAFKNGQKFMMDSSMSRSMLAFLQQISHGSVIDFRNFERKGASSEFKISNYHINKVSKGAQQLKNILAACSEGLKPDMLSIEIGMELFKSAKNLEESLRMLIGLQEAADNMTTSQQKSRIRLIEGNEDDVENPKLLENPKQIDRPKFSFDKQSNLNNTRVNQEGSNRFRQRSAVTAYLTNSEITNVDRSFSHMLSTVSHRQSFSDVGDSTSNTAASEKRNDMTLNTLNPEKKCLPNIIAKLMGLEEDFQHVKSKNEMHKEPESKQKNDFHMKDKGVKLSGHEMVKTRLLQAERIPIHKTASLDRHKKKLDSNDVFSAQNATEGRKILQRDTENAKKKNIALTKRASKHTMSENNITGRIQPQIIRDGSPEKERNHIISNERKPKVSMKQVPSTYTLSQGKRSNQKVLHILPVTDIFNKTSNSSMKITQNQEKLQNSFGSSKRLLFGQNENIIERHKVDGEEQKLGTEKSHVKDEKAKEAGMDHAARQCQTRENVLASSKVHSSINRARNIPDDIASCVFKNNMATDNDFDHSICPEDKGVQKELRKTNGPLLKEDKYVKVTTSMDKVPKSREHKGNSLKELNQVMSENKDLLQGFTKSQVHQIAISKDADSNSICFKDENSRTGTQPSPSTTTQPVNQEEKPSVLQIPNPADIPEAAASEASVCKHAPLCRVEGTVEARPYDVQLKEADLSVAGIDKMSSIISHLSLPMTHKTHKASKLDSLTEQESQLRDILVSNKRFQNTAVALFMLTIPVDNFQTGSQACEDQKNKYMLDTGYEIMKRKGRRQELSIHPFSKLSIRFPKVGSLDDLVKQLYDDFQMLIPYGGVFGDDAGTYLLKMVERDIYYSNPDINCMWDYGWDHSSFTLADNDHTVQQLERFILDDLIEDILPEI